jgi:hypothetical protein
MVGGRASGECGFGVVKPNSGGAKTAVPEHIAVSAGSLQAYFGKHTVTAHVLSLPTVTTESRYKITANLNNFRMAGTGLTGSGTVNPMAPPGMSGEALLATVYPTGSQSFIAYDTCNCRFQGRTGTIAIRFYGTSAYGSTHGVFLVVSGGTGHGGLSTLAGWGTFFGSGSTWVLIEHLRVT